MSSRTHQWYVQKKNKAQYGPVTMDELVTWAAQCRVVAGNYISRDRKTWQAVEELPELAMDWIAQRHDGKQYGPFPLAAVPELVEHDVLPRDAILTNRHDEETRRVQDVLEELTSEPAPQAPETEPSEQAPAPPETHAEPSAPPEEPPKPPETRPDTPETAATETQPNDHQPEIDKLQEQRKQQADALQQCRRQHEAEQKRFEQERSEWTRSVADLKKTIAALEQEQRATLEAQAGQRDQALVELRNQTAFMKKNIAALQAELATAKLGIMQRSRMLRAALVLITILIMLLVATASRNGCRTAPGNTDAPDTDGMPPAPFETPLPADGDATAAPPPNTDTSGTSTSAAIQLPTITVEGTHVQPDGAHALRLRFEQGIFRSLANLSDSGKASLDALARQLPPQLEGLHLEIRGHTDNVPLRSSSAFDSNQDLAQARAQAVAEHLIQRAGFPPETIDTVASDTAPYPNDTPGNRRRNRTVTIRIRKR